MMGVADEKELLEAWAELGPFFFKNADGYYCLSCPTMAPRNGVNDVEDHKDECLWRRTVRYLHGLK